MTQHSGKPAATRDESRSPQSAYSVRSLARALSILRSFDIDHPSWSLSDLSRRTGLHKATCFRLAKTLESERFLSSDPATGEYRLGPALLPLAYLFHSQDEFVRVAHPYLEQLVAETGETVDLAVWTGEGALFIDQILTAHPFKPEARVGRRFSQLDSATVKVLLAFALGPEARLDWIRRYAPDLSEKAALSAAAELNQVTEEEVAFDLEERSPGICAVAAPVRDSSRGVIATISVVAPTERFDPERRQRHGESVRRAAGALSAQLGFEDGRQAHSES